MRRIFKCILNKVCNSEIKEPFRAKNVSACLVTSTPFLSKHCIDKNNKNNIAEGNAYFIRIEEGLYIIIPKFRTCP